MQFIILNISNHLSSLWSDTQIQACKAFAINRSQEEYPKITAADVTIVDVPFPRIDPYLDDDGIELLACEFAFEKTTPDKQREIIGVHLMGEQSFCMALRPYLACPVFVSTTERIVTELPDGTKQSTFRFVQMRAI